MLVCALRLEQRSRCESGAHSSCVKSTGLLCKRPRFQLHRVSQRQKQLIDRSAGFDVRYLNGRRCFQYWHRDIFTFVWFFRSMFTNAHATNSSLSPGMVVATAISCIAVATGTFFFVIGLGQSDTQSIEMWARQFHTLNASHAKTKEYLTSGWSTPEPWGVWSVGPKASIRIPIRGQSTSDVKLKIHFRPFLTGRGEQTLVWSVSHQPVRQTTHISSKKEILDLVVPRQSISKDTEHIDLAVNIAHPTRPAEISTSADQRALGVGIMAVETAWLPMEIQQ